MKINSRAKGARSEREVAKILTYHGFPARRGQQFSGGKESPDVVCEILNDRYHLEVKNVKAGNLYTWIAQAVRDNPNKIPLVIHKRNNEDWVAILPLTALLDELKK